MLIKAYNFIRIIKCYYSLIKYAYLIIITKINNINKELILQIAFKAINDFISFKGLILTLLIYSAYL